MSACRNGCIENMKYIFKAYSALTNLCYDGDKHDNEEATWGSPSWTYNRMNTSVNFNDLGAYVEVLNKVIEFCCT